MSKKEKNNGKPSRNNPAGSAGGKAARGIRAAAFSISGASGRAASGFAGFFVKLPSRIARLPLAAKLAAGLALLSGGACLALFVLIPASTRLSVPESEIALFDKAFSSVWGKAYGTRLGITLVGHGKSDSIKGVLSKSDFLEIAFGYNAYTAIGEGSARPVVLEDIPGAEIPPALPAAIAAKNPGAAEGAQASRKGLVGIPLSLDPYLAFWRADWLGGAEAKAPAFYEDLFGKNGKAMVDGLLALPGNDDYARMATLLWLSALDPGNASPAKDPAVLDAGAKSMGAAASAGLFQKSSYNYGWSDSLFLLDSGKAKGMLAPLSRFRSAGLEFRQAMRISSLPVSSAATGRTCISDIRLVLVSARVTDSRAEKFARIFLDQRFQLALADARGQIPANLSGAFRDDAAFAAISQARSAKEWLIPSCPPVGVEDANRLSRAARSELISAIRK